MKKLVSSLLKVISVLSGLVGVGFSIFLLFMLSDKEGPYVETPFYIGMIVVVAAFAISTWFLSKNMTLGNVFVCGSFLAFVNAGYYAFTPIGQFSNVFMMHLNSGNLFTFYSDDSFELIKKNKTTAEIQLMYNNRLYIVIGLTILALVLFFISAYLNKKRKINTPVSD